MVYNPQIETFIKVADAGSFNKAAEELYITPTAVIKQINLLESSLNLVLFERTHRGLILTNAGKSLYQDAKYVPYHRRKQQRNNVCYFQLPTSYKCRQPDVGSELDW